MKDNEFRRKAPRRTFQGQAGVLYKGHMTITLCSQIGEGGLLLTTDELLADIKIGDSLVATLFLPNIGGVVAKSRCVYLTPEKQMGIEFEQIETKYKARIREFVSRQKAFSEA